MKKRKKISRIKHTPKSKKGIPHIYFTRYIIISSVLVLLFAVLVFSNKRKIAQSVAGASIMNGFYNAAIIPLPQIDGAETYEIYYKSSSDTTFVNSVRNIPANQKSYYVSYLKKGTEYQYEVSAVNEDGSEFWFSEIQPITNLQPM